MKAIWKIGFGVGVLFCLVAGRPLAAQGLSFSTLAGNCGYGSADGQGAEARFDFPAGVAVDAQGNVFVADMENSVIRQIDPSGMVTTLAGTAGVTGSADGPGSQAQFLYPQGVAVDRAGNVYVADTGNSTVRQITPDGGVTTLAGSAGMVGAKDGINGAASFDLPAAIAVDSEGVLYLADTYNNAVRVITASGTNWVVSTLESSLNANTNLDGTNTTVRFNQPTGIAAATNGGLWVADTGNDLIRRIAPGGSGWVTTSLARVGAPGSLAVDDAENLYVAASAENTLLKLAPSGTNWLGTLWAGDPGVPGSNDGPQGTNSARFNYPRGIAASAGGTLYVADSLNNTIRQVTPAGLVTTLAGAAGGPGSSDGAQAEAAFNAPLGLAVDAAGNVYVADSQNNALRRVTPAGVVTTLAGSASGGAGSGDGAGASASFNLPAAVAVDALTNLYVADAGNDEIRSVAWSGSNWVVATLAGHAGAQFAGEVTNVISTPFGLYSRAAVVFSGTSNYVNYSGVVTNITGVVTNLALATTDTVTTVVTNNGVVTTNTVTAVFSNLGGVVTNITAGPTNFYFVVTNTPLVSAAKPKQGPAPSLLVTNTFTLAPAPPLLDGPAADSLFHQPSGIAVGPGGALYVADGGTNGVRVISAGGRVSTLAASTGFYSVSASQFGTNRLFYQSSALAVDPAGNLYVADTANNTVREITASGSVLTIAGSPGLSGTADGTNGSARFASPVSIAVDARTNLWIADAWSDTLRKITALGGNWVVSTVGGLANVPGCTDASGSAARFYRPEGVALDLSGNLYVADTGNNTIRVGQAVTAGVVLQWSRRADAVVLVWPASATGFTLETSSNVASSGGWTPVTNAPPAPVGGAFTFTNAPGAPAGFFRLRHD